MIEADPQTAVTKAAKRRPNSHESSDAKPQRFRDALDDMQYTPAKFKPYRYIMNAIKRPEPTEYFEYFETYISKFKPTDFWPELEGQPGRLKSLLGDLPQGEDTKLHEPYTWTLKQVVGHVIDTERIFATRLLRIAVGDPTPNPDFEQNSYVAGLDYENVAMGDLMEEFELLRKSNVMMMRRFGEEQFNRSGTVSGRGITARAIPFLLGGHFQYHYEIMEQRLS